MDSFFCYCEIPSKQLLALFFGQGRAVPVHPFSVETSKAAIARRPITERTILELSALRPTSAKLDNDDSTVVGSPVPRGFVYVGTV